MRNRVGDGAETAFAFAQRGIGPHLLGDVEMGHQRTVHIAERIAQRRGRDHDGTARAGLVEGFDVNDALDVFLAAQGARHRPLGGHHRLAVACRIVGPPALVGGILLPALGHRIAGAPDALHHPVTADQLAAGVGDHDAGRDRVQQRVQAVALARRHLRRLLAAQLGFDVVGHVAALHEDAAHRARLVEPRLVDKVDPAHFHAAAARALQPHRHAPPDIGLGARVHLVEQLVEALALEFGQHLTQGLADRIAAADQVAIGRVGEFEAVLRAAQQGHEAGRVLEQLA
ncbi:hypothetical protein NX782_19275 [Massilia norwichensis]|uniref:Uncharacterized protein n=1 Tax=Massilia norwichensis TaxID=1442366 RepID=A0ABT2AAV7_9BURK|nr:hypothetical protein [Massilia norwichensis]MCS0591335.1 hypothetical protein [Massilia norwichensis]